MKLLQLQVERFRSETSSKEISLSNMKQINSSLTRQLEMMENEKKILVDKLETYEMELESHKKASEDHHQQASIPEGKDDQTRKRIGFADKQDRATEV
jgi:hypothetical protein